MKFSHCVDNYLYVNIGDVEFCNGLINKINIINRFSKN